MAFINDNVNVLKTNMVNETVHGGHYEIFGESLSLWRRGVIEMERTVG